MEQAFNHGNVEVVEVDFAVANAGLVKAPVVPEMADDPRCQDVGRFEIRSRSRLRDGAIRDCYRADLGET